MRNVGGVTKVNEFLKEGDEPAFGPKFWVKQKTWHCGISYAVGQLVLSLVTLFLIKMQKDFDWNQRQANRKKIKQQ